MEPEHLVAFTPAEMVPAQTELLAWCDRKIVAVQQELADLQANLELATEHGWKHRSVEASVNRTVKRVLYYEKLKAAVAAGYLIVPNFPVSVFAVRVERKKQREATSDYKWRRDYQTARPELLPAGEGRYVDEELFTVDMSFDERLPDGKTKHVSRYISGDYDEVDFPIVAVKPAILEATARAMALKIFDQLGLVQNQSGRDPIVVGQLIDPRGNGRRVTFFIAWWLNPSEL
jgi:hypothetical protein